MRQTGDALRAVNDEVPLRLGDEVVELVFGVTRISVNEDEDKMPVNARRRKQTVVMRHGSRKRKRHASNVVFTRWYPSGGRSGVESGIRRLSARRSSKLDTTPNRPAAYKGRG